MNIEFFRDYCLEKPFVTECFPFDDKTLVFKVDSKMFALADVESFTVINLKCSPEYAIELRERFSGVQPGYHMSKTHWNTVSTNEDVDDQLMCELIDISYRLVYESLTKKRRNELEAG